MPIIHHVWMLLWMECPSPFLPSAPLFRSWAPGLALRKVLLAPCKGPEPFTWWHLGLLYLLRPVLFQALVPF